MALRAPVNAESEPSMTGVDTGLMSGRTVDRPPSNAVQKSTIALVSLTFAMLVVIVAMAAATFNKIPTSINMYVPNVTVVKPAVGLPGFTQLSWSDVLNRTSGTTVNFFTCSTCVKYNQFIDTYFIPQMLANYNIKLVRIPSQAADAVALVQQQIAKVPTARNISVDLIWINLENYNTLRNPPGGGPSNAYGPWAFKVPSATNFDFTAGSIAYDGGVATAGYEFPYDGAQCVFIYNKNKITSSSDVALIKTIDGLRTWIKANPGRFTYAAPSLDATGKTGDYTGSAFIRHVFYAVAAPYTDFLGVTPTTDNGLYRARAPKFYQFLRDIEPYLYSATAGPAPYVRALGRNNSYPTNNTAVDALFGAAATYVTLSYTPSHAADMLATGAWSAATNPQVTGDAGYVMSTGNLANTNFVAIPTTSRNKLGAAVAANFLGTPQANYYRVLNLGSVPVYDPTSDAFTSGGWQVAFNTIASSPRTPTTQQMAAARMAELSQSYITQIQADWFNCVVKYNYQNRTRNAGVCG